jgi:hypothetical protein
VGTVSRKKNGRRLSIFPPSSALCAGEGARRADEGI